jgi:hypothetical protein
MVGTLTLRVFFVGRSGGITSLNSLLAVQQRQICSLARSASAISNAMAQAGVNESKVNKCLDASGGFDGGTTNSLLQLHAVTADVITVPRAFVNKVPIMGGLTFSTILKAVCAGFSVGSAPTVCSKCATCLDERKCIVEGHCSAGYAADMGLPSNGGGSDAFSPSVFAVALVVIAVLFVVATNRSRQLQQHVVPEPVPVEKGSTDATMASGISDGDPTASSIEGENGTVLIEFTLS